MWLWMMTVAEAGEDCEEAACAVDAPVPTLAAEVARTPARPVASLALCRPGRGRCAAAFVRVGDGDWEPGMPMVERRSGARASFWTVREHRRRRGAR